MGVLALVSDSGWGGECPSYWLTVAGPTLAVHGAGRATAYLGNRYRQTVSSFANHDSGVDLQDLVLHVGATLVERWVSGRGGGSD